MQDDAKQSVEEFLLDFGDFALDGGGGLAGAAQEHFKDGKDQGGVQFEDRVAIVRAQAERNHAGGGGKAVEEFGVRELFDADQVDGEIGAQVGGEAGNEVADEGVVEQVDGADLGFGNAVGAAEIEADGRGVAFALGLIGEYGIDLLLRQFPVQIPRSWVSYRLFCAKP